MLKLRHWLPTLGLVACAACGGKSVDTTIPIDDARLLNSEISATYVRTATLLEETSFTVDEIALFPQDVNPANIDTDLLRHVLEACFTETIVTRSGVDIDEVPRAAETDVGTELAILTGRTEVGRLNACNPSRMLALESYLPVIDETAQAFIIDRVLTVDVLRANLKDVLVAQIDNLERTTVAANTELAQLRETAAERRALAQTADLTPEERRRNEVDFETITQELDQVEEVLGQIASELSDWRRLRRALVDTAAQNIASLGTPQ